MEGSSLRKFPRTLLDRPVELHTARGSIRSNGVPGNLSAHGLYVHGQDLPDGLPVRVQIDAALPFEAEGVIRHHGTAGLGVEFTRFRNGSRERLDALIEELTRKGMPAA
jgi:hypothetical protein